LHLLRGAWREVRAKAAAAAAIEAEAMPEMIEFEISPDAEAAAVSKNSTDQLAVEKIDTTVPAET
jgi:hypothetical protein